jgi:CO/xanthine dehydrogenase Mo-binding subunit
VPRLDALDKVTGRARYVTDLERPGMLHAKLLRSPYPHARIVHVEVTRARAQAGVHTVVTGTDFGWCDPYFGPAFRDRPILAIDVARYEGEPVAAVVADDEEAAAEALELIEIEYEEIPAVTTLEEALAPGAALVHTSEPLAGYFADLATLKPKRGTNICHQFHLERVAGAAAFAEADVVVDDVYRFPRVQHYSMEPHAALADWDEDGGLTVWAATQNPSSVRVELARMFRVPLTRIRIIVPPLGGGFGGKTYAKLEPIVGALARMAQRPVRLALTVEEAFRTVRRCNARAHVRLGFKRDGTLWAAECHADFDVGAPTPTSVPASFRRAPTPPPGRTGCPTWCFTRTPSTRTQRPAAPSGASGCRNWRGRWNPSSTRRREILATIPSTCAARICSRRAKSSRRETCP